jgi:hypothetical protein
VTTTLQPTATPTSYGMMTSNGTELCVPVWITYKLRSIVQV